MARVTIEDCLDSVKSRFSLVHLAVRRVLQLRRGAPAVVYVPKNKEVVLALREIAAGEITLENIRQIEEQEFLPESMPEKKPNEKYQEVQEILEAETQPGVPFGLDTGTSELDDEEI